MLIGNIKNLKIIKNCVLIKMKGYWDKHKQGMFPWIKDWSKPQNHIRNKNIHDQTQKEWFWFSTSSYKLIYYGNSIISVLLFGFLEVYFVIKNMPGLTILFGVVALFLVYGLIKKIKNHKNIKDMTFYDLYLRKY